MRCKKNITCNVRNITLNHKILTFGLRNIISFHRSIILRLEILTSHFTGKEEILSSRFRNITLASIIIMLSFTNMTLCSSNIFNNSNVSALDYSSNVGIGFTFNPTLSISISPSDLIIDNLIPGSTLDSNGINVSVTTNAAYGYTLSANVGDDIHNNSNLTHTNNTSIFSSIAIDADLASLDDSEDSNIWGYSYKDNTTELSAWSNYNGLSNSSNTILLDNSNAADSAGGIDFKIGAKAGDTQASGTYTNTINFIAVSKVAPMSLLDSFIASGAEQLNGYYKMQDMTHDICSNVDIEESELQLIDVRDNKIYWVAKLKDGNCWMTQNLDLDIVAGSTNLTSNNTDLSTNENVYTTSNTIYALKDTEDTYGYTYENSVATWIPKLTTIAYNQLNNTNWQNSNTAPYSYNYLDGNGNPVYPDSNVSQSTAGDHGLSGNYYNWTASLASNDSTNATGNPTNSICPKGWRLPNATNKEFGNLLVQYNIISTNTSNSYIENVSSVNSMGASSLYFVRGGYINSGSLGNSDNYGTYWSGTSNIDSYAYYLDYRSSKIYPQLNGSRNIGRSVRCLTR